MAPVICAVIPTEPIRRGPRRRPSLVRAGAAAAIVVALSGVGASAAWATGHQGSRALVRSGPVTALEEHCGAKALQARVTIPRLVFAPAQAVTMRATVRNVGAAACTLAGGSDAATGFIGPCNTLSLEVLNSGGANIWPGTASFGCPALESVSLAAGGHFSTVGTWNQETAVNPHQVPAGHYRLIVGGTLSFSITIR